MRAHRYWPCWTDHVRSISLFSFALLMAAVTACGQTQGGPSGGTGSSGSIPSKVVWIGASGFQHDTVTVAAGHGLDFVNLPASPRRALCLGEHGVCDGTATGPPPLQHGGVLLRNEESYTVAFDIPGTYTVTTWPQPAHDLTVTVTG